MGRIGPMGTFAFQHGLANLHPFGGITWSVNGTVAASRMTVTPAAYCFTYCYDRKAMSKVSRKNQVTLPVRVIKEAGLAAGDEVVIRAAGRGRIEVERADDVIDRYAGSLPAGTYPRGHLDELRGEWRG